MLLDARCFGLGLGGRAGLFVVGVGLCREARFWRHKSLVLVGAWVRRVAALFCRVFWGTELLEAPGVRWQRVPGAEVRSRYHKAALLRATIFGQARRRFFGCDLRRNLTQIREGAKETERIHWYSLRLRAFA